MPRFAPFVLVFFKIFQGEVPRTPPVRFLARPQKILQFHKRLLAALSRASLEGADKGNLHV